MQRLRPLMTLVFDSLKARGESVVVDGWERGIFAPGLEIYEDSLVLMYWEAAFFRWRWLVGLERWL